MFDNTTPFYVATFGEGNDAGPGGGQAWFNLRRGGTLIATASGANISVTAQLNNNPETPGFRKAFFTFNVTLTSVGNVAAQGISNFSFGSDYATALFPGEDHGAISAEGRAGAEYFGPVTEPVVTISRIDTDTLETQGTVTVEDGKIRWTAPTNWAGTGDQFLYQIVDATGVVSNWAIVTVGTDPTIPVIENYRLVKNTGNPDDDVSASLRTTGIVKLGGEPTDLPVEFDFDADGVADRTTTASEDGVFEFAAPPNLQPGQQYTLRVRAKNTITTPDGTTHDRYSGWVTVVVTYVIS